MGISPSLSLSLSLSRVHTTITQLVWPRLWTWRRLLKLSRWFVFCLPSSFSSFCWVLRRREHLDVNFWAPAVYHFAPTPVTQKLFLSLAYLYRQADLLKKKKANRPICLVVVIHAYRSWSSKENALYSENNNTLILYTVVYTGIEERNKIQDVSFSFSRVIIFMINITTILVEIRMTEAAVVVSPRKCFFL